MQREKPSLRTLRLTCKEFYVDVRVRRVVDKWLASADTPDGPSLGWGVLPLHAVILALEPLETSVEDLITSLPGWVLSRDG